MSGEHLDEEETIRQTLRGIDGPVPLEPIAAGRIEERILARFEAEKAAPSGTDIIDLRTVPTSRARKPGPQLWLTVAAALLVVLGLFLIARDDPDTSTEISSAPQTSTPIDALQLSGVTLSEGILGFEETTTYLYQALDSNSQNTLASVQFRPGRVDANAGQMLVLQNAAALSQTDSTQTLFKFADDGAPIVPLDFLDPVDFGGACVGGQVELRLQPASVDTQALCGGQPTTVAVEIAVGATEPLPLLSEAIEAQPVSYRITPEGGATRTVTLWIAPRGLVRIDATVNGEQQSLNLNAGTLLNMEG